MTHAHLWVKSIEHFWWRCSDPHCRMVVLKEDLVREGEDGVNPSVDVLNRYARRWHW